MRKPFFVFSIIVLVFTFGSLSSAEDAKMIFDDVSLGNPYNIKGYAKVTLSSFEFVDMYAQWEDGKVSEEQEEDLECGCEECNCENGDNDECIMIIRREPGTVFSQRPIEDEPTYYYPNCYFVEPSDEDAIFAWLKVDIQNLQKSKRFIKSKEIKIQIIDGDDVCYDGWIRQFNPQINKEEIYKYRDTSAIGWPICLSPVDEMPIRQKYTGRYVFICELPKEVANDKKLPLRMIVTMGEHKFTYDIR